ncbi:MAG: type II toxin-antitoxin system VapC family toxin [Candidatus Riflebacteria bacterium]|nr:type II toxin-antitoxin system VapC family toxin [Candidatus Riflebacteria bacterium]
MIVVDTNILVYFWIPGDFTELAEKLLKKDSNWIAPTLWRSEFRNVLACHLRRKDFPLAQAQEIMVNAENHMQGAEHQVPSIQVLDLVNRSKCTAYDCEFIALAEQMSLPLITADVGLINSFPKIAKNIKSYVEE